MKNFIYIVFLFIIISCKKGEVPGNMGHYVGVWDSPGYDASYEIVIKQDGTAEYRESTLFSKKEITGYIYFDGYDFKIGARRINKKFKADNPPKRVTLSVQPYKYKYVATFNGVEYTKE